MKKAVENKLSPSPAPPQIQKPDLERRGVRIRMKPERALDGIAGPGEVAVVDRQTADYLINIGFAEEEESDNK